MSAPLTELPAADVLAASLQPMWPGLVAMLRQRLGNRALAEDVGAEAIRVTLERLRAGTLEEPGKIQAFLYQTARNLAIAEQRKGGRRHTSTGNERAILAHVEPGPDPAARHEAEDNASVVRQALERLPNARDREILVRYYLHAEPKDGLCRQYGLSDEHFNRVIHRARERLRLLLSRSGLGARELLSLAILIVVAGFLLAP